MKRYMYFCTMIASLVMLFSCQKDQEGIVTLNAITDQDAKAYIDDDRYPCWNDGDQVYINDNTYTISNATGSTARIQGVIASDSYCAIFPENLVTSGTNISSGNVAITLPSRQSYETVTVGTSTKQRVDMPMGALTSGSTLHFHNLCSIVRVTVNNGLSINFPIISITLTANNVNLSGSATATITESAASLSMPSTLANTSVTLAKADNRIMETLTTTTPSGEFDIIVPEFGSSTNTSDITIKIETTMGYKEFSVSGVYLSHNSIVPVSVTVNSLTSEANLVDGETFSNYIPYTATAIEFRYNSTVPNSYTGTVRTLSTTMGTPIYGYLDGTTWVVCTAADKINANSDCSYMFFASPSESTLRSIDFGSGFNTTNVTNMHNMFCGRSGLSSLNLSTFNTANVTDMSSMFYCCNSLSSLNLSTFNTANVTDMSYMFSNCRGLANLGLSSFSTSSVTNMGSMFSGCRGLLSLDLSHFNTSSVVYMNNMLGDCISLASLDVSNFSNTNVTDMTDMFVNCSTLVSLNLTTFYTPSATKMGGMFQGCSGLTSLNLSSFNTTSVTNMAAMFTDCTALSELNLSSFNTANVTSMYMMFYNCCSMTNLNIYNLSISSSTDKSFMCGSLASTSHACTIKCPRTTKTALQSGTNLPSSGVTFTWITH